MKLSVPAYRHCWVSTKWGRYKAKAEMEYSHVGGIHDGHIYVEVILQSDHFPQNEKKQMISKEHIEYIKE